MKIKIALAQINTILGDIQKNVSTHIEYTERAIDQNVDVIVFPELSLTGYVLRDLSYEVAINPFKNELLKPLRDLSKKIDIIFGGVEEGSDYGIFNSAFYLSHGECKFIHRKIYLPSYGLFEEERYFSTGRKLNSFNMKFGKAGILICEDFWHLPLPYILANQGVTLIFGLSSSPTRISPKDREFKQYEINSQFHRVYCRLLSIYIVWCNRIGYEEGMNYWGGSEFISPYGDIISSAKLFEPDFITAEISTDEIKKARFFSRHFLNDDLNFTANELNKILKVGFDK
jgi:predicted amidohydrolase